MLDNFLKNSPEENSVQPQVSIRVPRLDGSKKKTLCKESDVVSLTGSKLLVKRKAGLKMKSKKRTNTKKRTKAKEVVKIKTGLKKKTKEGKFLQAALSEEFCLLEEKNGLLGDSLPKIKKDTSNRVNFSTSEMKNHCQFELERIIKGCLVSIARDLQFADCEDGRLKELSLKASILKDVLKINLDLVKNNKDSSKEEIEANEKLDSIEEEILEMIDKSLNGNLRINFDASENDYNDGVFRKILMGLKKIRL